MVWVWDQPCNSAEYCKRLDLEVGGVRSNTVFVGSNVAVVLFVDVQIFDNAARQRILEIHTAPSQRLEKFVCDLRLAILHHDHRSADASFIGRDVDTIMVMVDVDADEFGETTLATK